MNHSQILISKYSNTFKKECDIVSVSSELYNIKSGYYKEMIQKCRYALSNNDKNLYKKLKSQLPAVTFSGTFDKQRTLGNLLTYSSLLIIDIDHLTTEEVIIKKASIFMDDYVFACWVSPSGIGLKILLYNGSKVEEHKLAYDQIVSYFENKYSVIIDKTGSDITRLCYVSYDDNLLLKEESKTFLPTLEQDPINDISNYKKVSNLDKSKISQPIYSGLNYLLYRTEGKNDRKDKINIQRIIKYLQKCNFSITTTYDDWYHVALAIANTFTYDLGKKYFLELCRLDELSHDEYKSIELLEYCYRKKRENEVRFATIIFKAQKHGFVLKH